ncbi:MAG: zinc-dependent peptidase [Aquabacterium sp.]|uniref:M90 family metallopeptidase n=1 Tax=Aquabacterium sp. TaxID=1872578 RepID=UPI0027189ACD|nr:M90 family metallopeptidase [Aquabacterium sp.]MDO9002112.1 zinc-dependent peptidase [Aquabacterium sp.]
MLIVTVLGLLLVAWFIGQPWLTERRRRHWRSQPFPPAWRAILKKRVPYLRALPADLQLQLKQHIQVFLAEKAFIGCAGLVITDEVRVTIAAQACLLILNRAKTDYYPELRQILVYPGAFIVDKVHTDETGVLQDHQRQVLSGESWSQGQVILSWQDTVEGAAIPDDAHNVVIHEFAHQLDQETGLANGAPNLPGPERYRRWSKIMHDAFDELQEQADRGEESLFDPYGATNPAEFFAVASETFFERPGPMAEQYPSLYHELCGFYRVNPLSW